MSKIYKCAANGVEDIATHTELSSMPIKPDQTTIALNSTPSRHHWPNAYQTLQKKNHTVGDYGSRGKFLFKF